MSNEGVRSQELIDSIAEVERSFTEHELEEESSVRQAVRNRFGGLLGEGYTEAEVVGAYFLGVDTPEAVRALLDGAPIEWAKAFESGEVPE